MIMRVYGSIEFLWLGHKRVLASDLSASLLSWLACVGEVLKENMFVSISLMGLGHQYMVSKIGFQKIIHINKKYKYYILFTI